VEPCNKWQLERSLGINSRWDFFAVAQLLWANCALEDKSCKFLVRHISCEIRICDWFLWKNSMHVNPDAFSTPVGSWTFPSSFQLLKTVLNEYGTTIYKANQHIHGHRICKHWFGRETFLFHTYENYQWHSLVFKFCHLW